MADLSRPWPLAGRTQWLLASAGLIALLVALQWVDLPISLWARSLPDPVIAFFAAVTDLGGSGWILIPALALALVSGGLGLVGRKRVPKLALLQMAGLWAFIFAGVGLPSLITTLGKRVIGRARPELQADGGALAFQPNWLDWTYQSFPSGHSTTIFAFAMVIGFLSPRWFGPALLIAVLVALSRVALGAHYPTDVVAGAAIGVLGAFLVRNLFVTWGLVFRARPEGIAVRPLSAVNRLLRRRRP